MDLSIIIVNWNSKDFLEKCLHSIFAQTTGIDFEVIVIDSASFDGCGRLLSEHFPRVRFIQSATNLGFASANNLAFQEATGDCTLFLNPDTEVVGSAIRTLHMQLKSLPDAGIVGARLLNTDGSLQASCVQSIPTLANQLLDSEFLRARWPQSRLWGNAPLFQDRVEASEVEAISGACLMTTSQAFREVGGFSEDYFMYIEDMDLARKVRQANYRNYYVPRATVVHHGGNSAVRAASMFAAVMMPEATLRFFRKTHGVTYSATYKCGMGVMACTRIALLSVARVFRSRGSRGASLHTSVRKWHAVLRWCLNRDPLVRKYYTSNDVHTRSQQTTHCCTLPKS